MESRSRFSSTIITLAALMVVVAGLKLAQPLLAPLLLAALITATCAPIAAWLSSRGLPASVGASVALLVGIGFLALCVVLIAYSSDEARAQLPTYWLRAQDGAGSVAAYLTRLGFHATRESVLSIFDASKVMLVVGTALTAGADVLPHLIVMPLLVFFALAEIAGFGDKLRFILPDTSRGMEQIETAAREVQKYLLVKTVTSFVAAVGIGVWLVNFKVDFAILLAVLAFLLHFIPNLGSAIAMVPGILVALLQHGPGTAVAVTIGYLVINGIVGNVVEPKVLGRTLGLSPLVVLLAMVFWGWLWGPIGALLSVPLTMIAKISLENSDQFGWVAVLIGPPERVAAKQGHKSIIPAILGPMMPQVRSGAPVGLGAGPSLDQARNHDAEPPPDATTLGQQVDPPPMSSARKTGTGGAFDIEMVDTDGVVEVRLSGKLTFLDAAVLWSKIQERITPKMSEPVRFDLSKVESIDGGTMALLVQTKWDIQSEGGSCEFAGSTGHVQKILELYEGDAKPNKRPKQKPVSAIAQLGQATYDSLVEVQLVLAFLGRMVLAIGGLIRRPSTGNWREIAPLMNRTGSDAVPIVVLINFLIGFVMGFQSAVQLKQFGANIYVADLVGLSLTRELGPLMTAIIVCGRSGAAFAAELGTMKVSEEVDALRTMGFGPWRFLVVPRMLALVLVMPILTLLADLVGIAGGLLVGVLSLDLTITAYLNETRNSLHMWDIFQGLIKSGVFGFAIGLIACQQGLATSGGAEGVGRRTTAAVVTSLFALILIDAGFTMLFYVLHL